MRIRLKSFRYIALTCILLCHFAAHSNQLFAWQEDDPKNAELTAVYQLKFVPAGNAYAIIHELVPVRLIPDERLNSLIVVAHQREHEMISELLAQIDVEKREPVKAKPKREMHTIPLNGLEPELVQNILQSTLSGREGVRLEVLEELGTIILSGNQEDVDNVQTVLAKIKSSARLTKQESSVYVSMTFIVEGEQIDDDELKRFNPPNSQIQSVIAKSAEAGLISIKNPMVVSKTVNRVRVDHELPVDIQKRAGKAPAFVNRSESSGKGYAMSNSGYIAQISGKTFHVNADIMLTVNSQLAEQVQGSTELNTAMEVPLNHPVLLSFSTILGVDSVVVLQVHEAK